jgi:hypothetical protein
MQTNLGFTQGEYYGNLSIAPSDKEYAQLTLVTQQILDGLPCPKNLVFHLELFLVDGEFLLCEIAARRFRSSLTQAWRLDCTFNRSAIRRPKTIPKARV